MVDYFILIIFDYFFYTYNFAMITAIKLYNYSTILLYILNIKL